MMFLCKHVMDFDRIYSPLSPLLSLLLSGSSPLLYYVIFSLHTCTHAHTCTHTQSHAQHSGSTEERAGVAFLFLGLEHLTNMALSSSIYCPVNDMISFLPVAGSNSIVCRYSTLYPLIWCIRIDAASKGVWGWVCFKWTFRHSFFTCVLSLEPVCSLSLQNGPSPTWPKEACFSFIFYNLEYEILVAPTDDIWKMHSLLDYCDSTWGVGWGWGGPKNYWEEPWSLMGDAHCAQLFWEDCEFHNGLLHIWTWEWVTVLPGGKPILVCFRWAMARFWELVIRHTGLTGTPLVIIHNYLKLLCVCLCSWTRSVSSHGSQFTKGR
jgi:hypothetical protein